MNGNDGFVVEIIWNDLDEGIWEERIVVVVGSHESLRRGD